MSWTPTALELMQGMNVALADHIPEPCDALFIHGSPVRDDELELFLLENSVRFYTEGRVDRIVINGLSAETCRAKNLAYKGCEPWLRTLEELGVPDEGIVVLEPSPHTGAESRNLLKLAKTMEWTKLVIASQAYHQLRCFLQIIALMEEAGFWPDVYNVPAPGVPWDYPMVKPVMAGGTGGITGDVQGALPEHIAAEYDRLVMYAQEPGVVDGRPRFTRHATIPEMLKYLKTRR